MKIDRTKALQLIAVIIVAFLFLLKNNFFIHHYSLPDLHYGNLIEVDSKPAMGDLNNLLITQEKKLDSLKAIKSYQVSGFAFLSGSFNNFIGIRKSEDHSKKPSQNNYLQLSAIGLKVNSNPESENYLQYFVSNGQSYFSKVKYVQAEGAYQKRYFFNKKVNFRYSSYDNSILLPLKSRFWINLIGPIIILIFILLGSAYLYIVINFFIFLIDISRNVIFDIINIKRLRNIVICSFTLSLIPLIIHYLIYMFFILNYGSEGIVLTYDFWKYDFYVLIFSIILFLFYSAFKSGLELKQENDLTI